MNAFRNLLKYFRRSRSSSRSQSRRSVRLELETLDQRVLPSASSFNMHAVTDAQGSPTAFFRSPSNDSLTQFSHGTLTTIATALTVTDFSAGLDAGGRADLFAHHNGHIELFDNGTWSDLKQPMPMQQFAAVDGGRAYFVGGDNSLWEFSPVVRTTVHYLGSDGTWHTGYITTGGWQQQWAANAVWGLDAVTERPSGVNTGRDVVFAVGGDGRLEAFTKGGWNGNSANKWQTLLPGNSDGSYRFDSFSAGLDGAGAAEVYYITTANEIVRWDAAPATSGGGTFHVTYLGDPFDSSIRATTAGQFFLEDATRSDQIYEYSDRGAQLIGPLPNSANSLDLAAADPDTCFYISSDGHHFTEWQGGYAYVYQI
jgi:hypothetical protein